MAPNLSAQRSLALANQLLTAGDPAGAERLLQPRVNARPDAQTLAVMGMLRLRQNQPGEAESLFARSSRKSPRMP